MILCDHLLFLLRTSKKLGDTMTNQCIYLEIPGTAECLRPGDKVKLGRFQTTTWLVNYGWFDFAGNRAFCGWFLTSLDTKEVKPLLKIDLEDIYAIE